MTSSTASRVSDATSGRSLSTRETVVIDTPARVAMSRIVARPFVGLSAGRRHGFTEGVAGFRFISGNAMP